MRVGERLRHGQIHLLLVVCAQCDEQTMLQRIQRHLLEPRKSVAAQRPKKERERMCLAVFQHRHGTSIKRFIQQLQVDWIYRLLCIDSLSH